MSMARLDLPRLKRAIADLNEYYEGTGIGFFMPSESEDYGIDIPMSGVSKGGRAVWSKMELKAVSPIYGDLFAEGGFYRRTAARNRAWRYGLTADTKVSQEAISADTTPKPEWCYTDAPYEVLNASTKDSRWEGSKVEKLLRERCGVIFMAVDGYYVFSPKDLKKAIVGYAWQLVPHTTEGDDSTVAFERKAVIDMNKYTRWIEKEVPASLLVRKTRKS